jgi:hypothetical protein
MKYPDTLLVRYYGLYKINHSPFVVMGNCFVTDINIHEIYDLKGSTYGRTNKGPGVKKDLDFTEAGLRLKLGLRKGKFLTQLGADVEVNI